MDNLGYFESNQIDNYENHKEETDIQSNRNEEENEQTTPQLFSEEEGVESFNQEINLENETKSMLKDDEEEDYEIPAFLRKQRT